MREYKRFLEQCERKAICKYIVEAGSNLLDLADQVKISVNDLEGMIDGRVSISFSQANDIYYAFNGYAEGGDLNSVWWLINITHTPPDHSNVEWVDLSKKHGKLALQKYFERYPDRK